MREHKSFDPAVIKASFIVQQNFGYKFLKNWKNALAAAAAVMCYLWKMFPQKSTK